MHSAKQKLARNQHLETMLEDEWEEVEKMKKAAAEASKRKVPDCRKQVSCLDKKLILQTTTTQLIISVSIVDENLPDLAGFLICQIYIFLDMVTLVVS